MIRYEVKNKKEQNIANHIKTEKHSKTWQNMTKQGNTWQNMAKHGKTQRIIAKLSKTQQNKAANKAKYGKTW